MMNEKLFGVLLLGGAAKMLGLVNLLRRCLQSVHGSGSHVITEQAQAKVFDVLMFENLQTTNKPHE
jgi:hypothetical protein